MADDKLQQKLIDYIEDAHALEQNVSRMLDSMISTTDDPEIEQMLKAPQGGDRAPGVEAARASGRPGSRHLRSQAGADRSRRPGEGRGRRGARGSGRQERKRRLHHRAHGDSRLPAA